MIELTLFTKTDGPLTKRISLDAKGNPVSDGSHCSMPKDRMRGAQP